MTRVRSSVMWFAWLAVAGCSRTSAPTNTAAADARVVVTVEPSDVRDVTRRVEVVGSLRGARETTVSAEVDGRVIELPHDLGDVVGPGAVLARLDPVEYELELAERAAMVVQVLRKIGLDALPQGDLDVDAVPAVVRAALQVENERAKYERGKTLFAQDSPVISDQDLADLETQWQVAIATHDLEITIARALLAEARTREAERRSAEQRLTDTVIHAPPDLRSAVGRRLVDVGEFVRAGDALFALVVADPVDLLADVPERYAQDIALGQRVTLAVDASPQPFVGEVVRVAPSIDAASRTFRVEIRVANPNGELRPGGFARAEIETRVDHGVTFVPLAAVATYVGESKVFSIVEGRAVAHRIRTGIRVGERVEVVEGFVGVAPLIVTGLTKIADATAVLVKPASAIDGPPIAKEPEAPDAARKDSP
ncbi:MAG: efflux RND transporter periplasmic adaptor subunit [Planctomycetes bacterium]|nr:efflux RND transporter periplasmic adaptor subunit [Planctomycetota bacterium]MCC7169251.1 efflux RND transporter periplasmic adaptor subunit [Planctomycetota bacterium]